MAQGKFTSSMLMERYSLSDDACSKQITDTHLEELSRTHCRHWRRLPSHLEMDSIVEHDVDSSSTDEGKRRHNFFMKWKERKGSDATYKALITALLKVDCRADAEYICKLLNQHSQQCPVETSPNSVSVTSTESHLLAAVKSTNGDTVPEKDSSAACAVSDSSPATKPSTEDVSG